MPFTPSPVRQWTVITRLRWQGDAPVVGEVAPVVELNSHGHVFVGEDRVFGPGSRKLVHPPAPPEVEGICQRDMRLVADDLDLSTAAHVHYAIMAAMQPKEREMAMWLPSGRRRYRRVDSIELAIAQPARVLRGHVAQPGTDVGPGSPRRHHHVEPAAEKLPRCQPVVYDAVIVAKFSGE
jgi:hypothetical protein